MSTPNYGGPAFPTAPAMAAINGLPVAPGMTLRDWFAGQANENDIADLLPTTVGETNQLFAADGVARTRQWARYRHADLMLAKRAKGAKP